MAVLVVLFGISSRSARQLPGDIRPMLLPGESCTHTHTHTLQKPRMPIDPRGGRESVVRSAHSVPGRGEEKGDEVRSTMIFDRRHREAERGFFREST